MILRDPQAMIILGQEGMANSNQPKNSTLLETHESVPVVDPGLDLEIQRHHYEDIDTIYLTIR